MRSRRSTSSRSSAASAAVQSLTVLAYPLLMITKATELGHQRSAASVSRTHPAARARWNHTFAERRRFTSMAGASGSQSPGWSGGATNGRASAAAWTGRVTRLWVASPLASCRCGLSATAGRRRVRRVAHGDATFGVPVRGRTCDGPRFGFAAWCPLGSGPGTSLVRPAGWWARSARASARRASRGRPARPGRRCPVRGCGAR